MIELRVTLFITTKSPTADTGIPANVSDLLSFVTDRTAYRNPRNVGWGVELSTGGRKCGERAVPKRLDRRDRRGGDLFGEPCRPFHITVVSDPEFQAVTA